MDWKEEEEEEEEAKEEGRRYSHCWNMLSWEAVCCVADKHAGLADRPVTNHHTLDTMHLLLLLTSQCKKDRYSSPLVVRELVLPLQTTESL